MSEQRTKIAEDLLIAWLTCSMNIRANRFLSNLTFNQMIVCGFLAKNLREGGNGLTATELCEVTGLLKSQMNKVLSQLDERDLIARRADPNDARRTVLTLAPCPDQESMTAYEYEHEQIMAAVEAVTDALGEDKAQELTRLLHAATEAAKVALDLPR